MPMSSFAETEFWSRQFSEHLQFLEMLFTDAQAKADAAQLKAEYDQARAMALADPMRSAELIRPAHDLVRAYQGEMVERLSNGEFLGWAFPLFVDHVTREMDLYGHLVGYGNPAPDNNVQEAVKRMGAEHAQFASHLLDPTESNLSRQASAAAYALYSLADNNSTIANKAAAKAQRVLAGWLEKNRIGTPQGALSIVPKTLADHVIREQHYYASKLEQ